MVFFIPVIYTLTFGGLFYKNKLTDVPIIVCNLDDGFQSQGLIRDLYDTPEIAIKFVQMSPIDFEQYVVKGSSIGRWCAQFYNAHQSSNGGGVGRQHKLKAR